MSSKREYHPKNFLPELIGLASGLVPHPNNIKKISDSTKKTSLEDILKASKMIKDCIKFLKSGGIKDADLDFFYDWLSYCYDKGREFNIELEEYNISEGSSGQLVEFLKTTGNGEKMDIEGEFEPFSQRELTFFNKPTTLQNPSQLPEKPIKVIRNKRKSSLLSLSSNASLAGPSISSSTTRARADSGLGNKLSKLSESSSHQSQFSPKNSVAHKPFVPPGRNQSPKDSIDKDLEEAKNIAKNYNMNSNTSKLTMPRTSKANKEEPEDERLKNLDANMIQMIKNEIMGTDLNITWDDIAGLTHAKKTMNEIIVQPIKRPDLFRGLTAPPKGLLLFGPPGTGKTLIGKCIASESQATFFSISASTLTSKWVGEGEKMMRTLFAVARCHQPAVVFLDEVDSLLTSRTEGENEASRRIKTEFLVQFEGVGTTFEEDRILIIGATNRPQEIDEAARRRFRKRLYIPLPDFEGRLALIKRALRNERNTLSEDDFKEVAQKTEGYSGSDLYGLCQEAAFVPLRNVADISSVAKEDVEPISISSFNIALTQIRKSVASSELKHYEAWNQEFGSMG